MAWDLFTEFLRFGIANLPNYECARLVRLKEDGDSLVMPSVPLDEREMLVETQPKIFYFTDHYRDYPMVLIRLSKAKRATIEPFLRRRWRELASKKAVQAFDATA